MLKLRKNKKGFSLVELIVVIAIMAVLAGVVGGTLFSQLNKQKNNSADSEAKTLANSIKTAIQADPAFSGGTVDLAAIVSEAVADNEGALTNTATDAVKAGDHIFFIDDVTNGIIIDYSRVGSTNNNNAVAGYAVIYQAATATDAASVLVQEYELAARPDTISYNSTSEKWEITKAASGT